MVVAAFRATVRENVALLLTVEVIRRRSLLVEGDEGVSRCCCLSADTRAFVASDNVDDALPRAESNVSSLELWLMLLVLLYKEDDVLVIACGTSVKIVDKALANSFQTCMKNTF